VSEKEITVNYTIPMPVFPSTNDMTHDGIGVLAFESSGRPYRSRTCDTLIKRYRRIVPESK